MRSIRFDQGYGVSYSADRNTFRLNTSRWWQRRSTPSPAFTKPAWPGWAMDFASLIRLRISGPSVVPCHRRQLGHVLQQYPSTLQVQNAVLAPELQLTVDALAGSADEDAELLLRDVHFGPEVGGERTEPSRQADRQRLQHRFLHPLALPADALAQQHHDLDGDLGLAFQEGQEILAPQHEQFRRLAGGGVRGAALAVEHRHFAEQVAGAHEIQGQAAAV